MTGYEERASGMSIFDFGGRVTDRSEFALVGNTSPDNNNVELVNGLLRKRRGASELADLAVIVNRLAAIYSPISGNGFLYAFGADGVLKRTDMPGTLAFAAVDPPDGVTAYPTGRVYTEAAPYIDDDATTPYQCLYVPRGDGPPIVLTGDAVAADDAVVMQAGVYGDTSPASGTIGYPTATSGAGHQDWDTDPPTAMRVTSIGKGDRLLAFRFVADPARVDYSEIAAPANFLRQNVDDASVVNAVVDGGYFFINKGDDDVIVDVADMYAYRVFMKQRAIFIYSGDPGADDWNQDARFDVGVVGHDAWARVGNDIYFWSDDGPRRLKAVQEYGDLQQSNLAEEKIKVEIAAINPDYAPGIVCLHDTTNSRVIWYVPLGTSQTNNAAYVYYYNTGHFVRWDGPVGEITAALAVRTDVTRFRRLIGVTADGVVGEMFNVIGDFGESIDAYYITRWMSPNNDAGLGAHATTLDVIFGNDGRGDCAIYYETDMDGVWRLLTRITKTHGGAGARYNSGVQYNSGVKYNQASRQFMRFEMNALFNVIRFKFASNSIAAWDILGLNLDARVKGARA